MKIFHSEKSRGKLFLTLQGAGSGLRWVSISELCPEQSHFSLSTQFQVLPLLLFICLFIHLLTYFVAYFSLLGSPEHQKRSYVSCLCCQLPLCLSWENHWSLPTDTCPGKPIWSQYLHIICSLNPSLRNTQENQQKLMSMSIHPLFPEPYWSVETWLNLPQ